MNTLEWMPIFLPSLWLFAIYISDPVAAVLGLIWIAGPNSLHGRLFEGCGEARARLRGSGHRCHHSLAGRVGRDRLAPCSCVRIGLTKFALFDFPRVAPPIDHQHQWREPAQQSVGDERRGIRERQRKVLFRNASHGLG